MEIIGNDLFGNPIPKDDLLRERFIEPPFSLIDTRSGKWQARKKLWMQKGFKAEINEDSVAIKAGTDMYRPIADREDYNNRDNYVSIFDPALCEVVYHWFCPDGGSILDPFAGGAVRGIVAAHLGYNYTGIEIRREQIDSNMEQLDNSATQGYPQWLVGDSNTVLDTFIQINDVVEGSFSYDLVFSCPPYANLEKYSDLEGDISNMTYEEFLSSYESIINKSCSLLKSGCFACFVVGEVRGDDGNYLGFVPDTIAAFKKCGMDYYNEAIIMSPVASASMRAGGNMKSRKLVKIHQNLLVFKKP